MRMTCPRTALAAAFATVSGVVPSRTPKPILQNVKLITSGSEALLIGTDQEVGIRARIPSAEVEVPGEILLPNARTNAILRELQGETVAIESSDEGTWIRGDRAEYKLASENPAEFPNVAEFDAKSYFVLPADQLRVLIRRTIFATDAESTRYALGGVLLEMKGDQITLAATDTKRLAVVKGTCAAEGGAQVDNAQPVVPSKAMSLIERSLATTDEPAWVAIRANDVLVKAGSTTLYSRLVEGRFPRYQDVIPSSSAATVELTAGPFHAAVRQAQIVTSEDSRGVDFQFGPGLMTLKSQAAEIGQSKIELPIAYDGPELTITFDPRYIGDFLKVLSPEQLVRLELNDSESPGVLRTDDGYTYIVMPLSRDR